MVFFIVIHNSCNDMKNTDVKKGMVFTYEGTMYEFTRIENYWAHYRPVEGGEESRFNYGMLQIYLDTNKLVIIDKCTEIQKQKEEAPAPAIMVKIEATAEQIKPAGGQLGLF